MWELRPIEPDGLSFWVGDPTPSLSAVVVDPDLPWILLERFAPTHHGWQETAVSLSIPSPYPPRRCRVRHMALDVLLRTQDFLDAVPEIGLAQPCFMVWQLDREPKDDLP